MGVLAALKARNLAGKVVLVGNDGISDALAAIAVGQMYATNGLFAIDGVAVVGAS